MILTFVYFGLPSLQGIFALYPLIDAADEITGAVAKETGKSVGVRDREIDRSKEGQRYVNSIREQGFIGEKNSIFFNLSTDAIQGGG